MAIIYRDHEFMVENRFFAGWRVTDLCLRKTYKPSRRLVTKLGLTWPLVRNRKWKDAIKRRSAENLLMQVFALAVTEPGGSEEILFLHTEPHDLAAWIVQDMQRRNT